MAELVKYKVLQKNQTSVYMRDHKYKRRRWYEEPDAGKPGSNSCLKGLYATDIEGLLYRGVWREDEAVFRCKVKGPEYGETPFKTCYGKLQVLEQVSEEEVRKLAQAEHDRLGYLLEEALYPINPFKIKRTGPVTEQEVQLLKDWDSVWASVRDSVWDNVRDSVGDNVRDSVGASVWSSVWSSVWASVGTSVRNSVRASVRARAGSSVWDSVWNSVGNSVGANVGAYIGSLFPLIKSWKYIDRTEGVYPFQAGSELWRAGLVPSYDGFLWRLHAGPAAEVVWEGK